MDRHPQLLTTARLAQVSNAFLCMAVSICADTKIGWQVRNAYQNQVHFLRLLCHVKLTVEARNKNP